MKQDDSANSGMFDKLFSRIGGIFSTGQNQNQAAAVTNTNPSEKQTTKMDSNEASFYSDKKNLNSPGAPISQDAASLL